MAREPRRKKFASAINRFTNGGMTLKRTASRSRFLTLSKIGTSVWSSNRLINQKNRNGLCRRGDSDLAFRHLGLCLPQKRLEASRAFRWRVANRNFQLSRLT